MYRHRVLEKCYSNYIKNRKMSEQILLIPYHFGGIKMCVYSSGEKYDNFRKVSMFLETYMAGFPFIVG